MTLLPDWAGPCRLLGHCFVNTLISTTGCSNCELLIYFLRIYSLFCNTSGLYVGSCTRLNGVRGGGVLREVLEQVGGRVARKCWHVSPIPGTLAL